MRMTRTITYNGKSVKTKYHSALEWQEFHELRAQYYAKPSIEQVQLEILKFHQGGVKTNIITNYYFNQKILYCFTTQQIQTKDAISSTNNQPKKKCPTLQISWNAGK